MIIQKLQDLDESFAGFDRFTGGTCRWPQAANCLAMPSSHKMRQQIGDR